MLLAIFLGNFGVHHSYLRRDWLGLLYLVLFWTGIPSLLCLIEDFFMPGRVREFNADQAAYIACQIVSGTNLYPPPIHPSFPYPACGGAVTTDAGFCPHCGVTLAAKT